MFKNLIKTQITMPLMYYLVVFVCILGMVLWNAATYKIIFNNLTNENNDLKANYTALENKHTSLESEHAALKQANANLEKANADLQNRYQEQTAEMDKMKETITDLQAIPKVDSTYGVEKTWMSYRAISSPDEFKSGWVSPQWKVQQKAYTDEKGFRKVDEYYCIAIGFGWNCKVGDTVLVVLSSGNSFKAIMGDEKSWEHTDEATHKVHVRDGSVVEFIIDPDVMDPYYSRKVGIKAMPEFSGSVVGIYKLGSYDI